MFAIATGPTNWNSCTNPQHKTTEPLTRVLLSRLLLSGSDKAIVMLGVLQVALSRY